MNDDADDVFDTDLSDDDSDSASDVDSVDRDSVPVASSRSQKRRRNRGDSKHERIKLALTRLANGHTRVESGDATALLVHASPSLDFSFDKSVRRRPNCWCIHIVMKKRR